ncbi:hypothetical protein [Wolinella succinogenes]|uniref:hypothetical protein n=1 Tax=Wolinella succinogenes TaxID=844 RepID=UPI002FC5C53A
MKVMQTPKVVSQHVDTLVVGYRPNHKDSFFRLYSSMLEKLEILKSQAREEDSFGSKFVESDLGLSLGNFRISSRGNGKYAYYVENESFIAFIGRFDFDRDDLPHVVVRFRSHFLFQVGVKKALDLVDRFVNSFCGSTTRQLNEIHLATDVWGIRYEYLDGLRFQTKMGRKNFCEIMDFREYGRYTRVQGYHFGKGDFLFRIYDKTKKIQQSPSESYVIQKWTMNGYEKDLGFPVQRHELQLRRAEIKKFIPRDYSHDEVIFFLEKLDSLWFYGLSKIEFVSLTNDEVLRIGSSDNANTKRSIYFRAKNDSSRFHFWQILQCWDDSFDPEQLQPLRAVKEAKAKTAERLLKGFFASAYKALGCNPYELSRLVISLNQRLKDFEGVNLHEYALSKVAGDFVKNERLISRYGINPTHDYRLVASEALYQFNQVLLSVNNPEYTKDIIKAVGLLS